MSRHIPPSLGAIIHAVAVASLLAPTNLVAGCSDEGTTAPPRPSSLSSGGGEGGAGGSGGQPAAAGQGGTGGASGSTGNPCGGPSGLTCGEGAYCSHEGGEACDAVGQCRERPPGCLTLCDPGVTAPTLCGCDGGLYCAKCDANFKGVSLSPDPGRCEAQ